MHLYFLEKSAESGINACGVCGISLTHVFELTKKKMCVERNITKLCVMQSTGSVRQINEYGKPVEYQVEAVRQSH